MWWIIGIVIIGLIIYNIIRSTKNYIIITTLISFICCNANVQKSYEAYFAPPPETSKIIETRYYEPIYHNNKWICGEEINHISTIPNIVYLDSYNHEILKIKIYDEVENRMVKIRKIYSEDNEKINKIYINYFGEYGIIDCIRDNNGNLLEVKLPSEIHIPMEVYNDRFTKFEYDSCGTRIIEKGENITKYIKRIPLEKTIHYEIYDDNCIYSYGLKKGIIESGIQIFDTLTKVLSKEIIQNYKYGELDSRKEITYQYDKENRLVREIMNGSRIATYYAVPKGLSFEEQESYIKEHYYGENASFTEFGYVAVWEYNSYGDCTRAIEISLPEEEVNPYSSERREYVYNEKGEWIKCIVFPIGSKDANEIITRKITYLDE